MKPTLATLATGIVLVAAGLVPVISEDMKLLYSYEYVCVGHVQQVLGEDSVWRTPEYSPEPCAGTIPISVFADSNQNHVYEQIPLAQYRAMGQTGGFQRNPKKDEFKSLLDAYVLNAPPVSAAVRGANASASASGASITWAQDNGTLQNRFIVAAGMCNGTIGDTITSIKDNGLTMTIKNVSLSINNSNVAIGVLANPPIGINNVLVTCNAASAGNAGRSIAYSSVYQSFFDGINSSGEGTASSTVFNTMTLTTPGSWHVAVIRHDAGNALTGFIGCTPVTADGGLTIVDSGPVQSIGVHTCTFATTGSNDVWGLGVALPVPGIDFDVF